MSSHLIFRHLVTSHTTSSRPILLLRPLHILCYLIPQYVSCHHMSSECISVHSKSFSLMHSHLKPPLSISHHPVSSFVIPAHDIQSRLISPVLCRSISSPVIASFFTLRTNVFGHTNFISAPYSSHVIPSCRMTSCLIPSDRIQSYPRWPILLFCQSSPTPKHSTSPRTISLIPSHSISAGFMS